jgi:hypothetical protein
VRGRHTWPRARPYKPDEHAASKYGELLAWVRDRRRLEKATDRLIAATAGATDRRLYTLDRRHASLAKGAGLAVESLAAPPVEPCPEPCPQLGKSDPSKPDPLAVLEQIQRTNPANWPLIIRGRRFADALIELPRRSEGSRVFLIELDRTRGDDKNYRSDLDRF